MKYFLLPQTDLKVSKVALGCMRIANKSFEEVEELILKSLELGINFFDHADIYGRGKSEEIFGEFLKKYPHLREKMIIQSKCGIRPGVCYDFSKEHILKSVDDSLKRLNIEYLDILLLHRPDILCDPKEVAEAFNELYITGKVRYFGVSNHSPYQIELLKKYCKQPIIINQLQFGPAHTVMIDSNVHVNMKDNFSLDHDGGVLDYCRLKDITIQPWSTIRGSLDEDTFLDNPSYPELNRELEFLSTKYNVPKVAIVTAWILKHPANMQPILGTTSLKNLLDTLKGINIELTREEWYKVYMTEGRYLP